MARRYRRLRGKIVGVGFLGVLLFIGWFTSLPALYQTVIVFTGFLVVFLYYRRKRGKEERLLRSGISEIDQLSGEDFERVLAMGFTREGYSVKLTPEFGDFGADLIMTKDGVTTVVQAKRYSNTVGIEAVQAVVAAKAYYKAQATMVITNSTYTPAAIELAKVNEVTLWGRQKLIDKLHEINGATLVADYTSSRSVRFSPCPECGKMLVERSSRRGTFYGCSGYPNCQFVQSV